MLIFSPQGIASITRITLSGSAIKGAVLPRARWRPAAIHSGLSSSTLGKAQSRLWIMEVRPVFGEKDFYSPITTPFGYFGSTLNAAHTSSGTGFIRLQAANDTGTYITAEPGHWKQVNAALS